MQINSKITLLLALAATLLLLASEVQAGWAMTSTESGLAIGLGVGLGVGMPFVCTQAANVVLLSSFLKEYFNTSPNVYKFPKDSNQKINQIKCPEGLSCKFETDLKSKGKCGWRNDKNDSPCAKHDFYVVDGSMENSKKWSKLMGNKNVPKDGFLSIVTGKHGFSANLISDIIPSQPGNGKLRMQYWITQPAKLNVCLLHKKSNFTDRESCTGSVGFSADSVVEFNIPGPISAPFKFSIGIGNFTAKQGSFAVIDEIDYKSDLCGDQKEWPKCGAGCINV